MADAEAYRSFLTNVIMGEHLARLPEEKHAPFIDTLTEGAASWRSRRSSSTTGG